AIRRQRPDDVLFPPIFRHPDSKQETMTPRVEVRRLCLRQASGLDDVRWSERNIEFFLVIPIQVTEDHIEGAVGILLPPLEIRRDVLPADVLQLLRGRDAGRRESKA